MSKDLRFQLLTASFGDHLPSVLIQLIYEYTIHTGIYLFGGIQSTAFRINYYSIDNNEWTSLHELPYFCDSSSLLFDCKQSKIYFIGGCSGLFIPLRNCLIYNLEGKRWSNMAAMIYPRTSPGVWLYKDYILTFGGYGKSESEINEKNEMYDVKQDKWKEININLITPRCKFNFIECGNKFYCIGGKARIGDYRLKTLNSCEVLAFCRPEKEADVSGTTFTPADSEVPVQEMKLQWKEVASLNVPRASFAITCSNQEIYVFGGENQKHVLDTIEIYDIKLNIWTLLTNKMPTILAYGTASMINNQIYLCGGYNGTGAVTSCLRYNHRNEIWTEVQSMPAPRSRHCACVVEE